MNANPVRLVAWCLPGLIAVGLLVVGVGMTSGATGITGPKLEAAVATTFAHLYRRQQEQLGNPPVTLRGIGARAECEKGDQSVRDVGPGNDWRCLVYWHVVGTESLARATYRLDVMADGRYVADGEGPKEVNGSRILQTPDGNVTNPLWQFDGVMDITDDA